jgi:hypothetical protein
MAKTYKDLLKWLVAMPDARLEDTATIQFDDEYFAVDDFGVCDDGVLDDGHLFMVVGE